MSAKARTLDEKPNFRELLSQCGTELVTLFDRFRDLTVVACHCDDWGYTDKPDCRFCWEHIICEMVPRPGKNSIFVMLRVDRIPIDTLLPTLREITIHEVADSSRSKPGMLKDGRPNPDSRWVQFEVNQNNQLPDAIAIIARVFSDRRRAGW